MAARMDGAPFRDHPGADDGGFAGTGIPRDEEERGFRGSFQEVVDEDGAAVEVRFVLFLETPQAHVGAGGIERRERAILGFAFGFDEVADEDFADQIGLIRERGAVGPLIEDLGLPEGALEEGQLGFLGIRGVFGIARSFF